MATCQAKGKKATSANSDDNDDDWQEEELPLNMSKRKVLIKEQMWILYNLAAKLVLFTIMPGSMTKQQ